MNTSSASVFNCDTLGIVHNEFAPALPALHRIRTVRRQQGLNLRGLARKTGESLYDLAREELERTDFALSRLYWWQRALDVPITELLVEPDAGLSPPILERARVLRMMKTVAAMKEVAEGESLRRLIETLENQVLEIAPEMSGVQAWNSVGQRRTLDELGRIAEQMVSLDDVFDD
jgi:transcriptional regulator with XRE-family HTH domain